MPIPIRNARKIMGDTNFIDFSDILNHFPKSIKRGFMFGNMVPYSQEYLEERSTTDILIFINPFSMKEMFAAVSGQLKPEHASLEEEWWTAKTLPGESKIPQWLLIEKTALKRGTGLSFDEQQKKLNPRKKVPNIRQLVYATILYYCITDGAALALTDGVVSSSCTDGNAHIGFRLNLDDPADFETGILFEYFEQNTPLKYGIGISEPPK